MKKEVYLTILFDYYSELLTDKQRTYFTNYYFDNLSLSEIADNLSVSRNAIHKQLKLVEEKLLSFEDILKLYQKDETIKEIIKLDSVNEIKTKLEELIK